MKGITAVLFTCGLVASAHAQDFPGRYVGLPNSFDGICCVSTVLGPPNTATDYVSMGQLIHGPSGDAMNSRFFLPLSSFASSTQIAAANARIDQAFRLIEQNAQHADRGIAASAAMANIWMPSAPGRTTWAVNGAAFQSEIGGGISVAHRLNVSMPIAVTCSGWIG